MGNIYSKICGALLPDNAHNRRPSKEKYSSVISPGYKDPAEAPPSPPPSSKAAEKKPVPPSTEAGSSSSEAHPLDVHIGKQEIKLEENSQIKDTEIRPSAEGISPRHPVVCRY